jgi:La domain
MQQGQP